MQGSDVFTASIGQHWSGYNSLKNLVVFGASYCAVGYTVTCPHPTKDRPLGVEFPGTTYTEEGEPNWVGYLVRDYSLTASPLLVYDYAIGGQTVAGVVQQVENKFIPYVGQKPDWTRWSETDTLFVTWVGINDCAYNHDPERSMKQLFAAQDKLYKTGARNFLFIDVPPMHRCPGRAVPPSSVARQPHWNWNLQLRSAALSFSQRYDDATVLVFSSWDVFTAVLDDPTTYGFPTADIQVSGGSIWIDSIHPTSKVHGIIAKEMVEFLGKLPPFGGSSDKEADIP